MLMRSVALCLLTSAWIFLFSGCPYEPEQEQDMTGCSYVAEAYHGYFTPNKADNIYELYLDQTLPDVTWHLPYPFTGAGAVSWDTFARSIWPK
mgnify:CR=1 FL=1